MKIRPGEKDILEASFLHLMAITCHPNFHSTITIDYVDKT